MSLTKKIASLIEEGNCAKFIYNPDKENCVNENDKNDVVHGDDNGRMSIATKIVSLLEDGNHNKFIYNPDKENCVNENDKNDVVDDDDNGRNKS
ncbi:MAG: hypothetical protein R3Y24_10985 [Eubacteriales bacterium]